MARVETDHRWYWEGKQDRWYYVLTYNRYHTFIDRALSTPSDAVKLLRGTVTRNTKTNEDTFNRWFAQLNGPTKIKSEPLMTLRDAKAWLEVIERMNR